MLKRFTMKSLLTTAIVATSFCLFAGTADAQIALRAEQFSVFDKDGKPSSIAQIVEACREANVLFLGEEHDDAVGHALQAEIFKQVVGQYKRTRKVALSMEMFERDTQVVVDEYLKDQITERQFVSNARAWERYETDYKPLVLEAKSHGLPVIAANAPRRYVNMVTRKGRAALEALSPEAKKWLPPLPYAQASDAYTRKFNALMGGAPAATTHGGTLSDSQSLWDASMAYWIAQYLKSNANPLVVQLNGKFHSEQRLGTVEHLLAYQPSAKALVVTVLTSSSFPQFDARTQQGLGDFVIITDPKVAKSSKPAG